MDESLPLVSIIMATYNRAHTLRRSVESVLNQTYSNFELIIVNDGSNDDTSKLLEEFHDPRIRVFVHDVNKGATAAKNTGLEHIKGEWFGTFDSDDELKPDAIEVLMNVPLRLDKSVTSVIGNGVDSVSGVLTGTGLTHDGYIDGNEILSYVDGEFWGLMQTSLLLNDKLNEKLRGFEGVLWYKINSRANKYYVHRALDIIHTEGKDRITVTSSDLKTKKVTYENLIEEKFYLDIIARHRPAEFNRMCRNGILVMNAFGERDLALRYHELFRKYSGWDPVIELAYWLPVLSLLIRVFRR
jgi:glycosyltransferase involved in cell wall biosynthesis